jgi:iron complex outermembrane receptor protein
MRKWVFLAWFCAFFPLKTWAVEFETVVKDIQFNSSSRIVIDKDEIEKSHARSLTTLLATQANVSIVQSNFTPTSIYIRGGDSSHVLILVDGVPFYDASSIQRTINLNSIDIKSVQKIEVIKGSQSVLYGGQALSGVIKIETVPKDLKSAGYGLAQGGNFHQEAVAAGGTLNLRDESALVIRGSYSQKDAASPVLDSKYFYPTHLGTAELGYINRNQDLQYLLKAQTSFDKTFIATTAFPAYSAADTNNFETSTYQMNYTGYFSIPSSWLKPTLSVSAQQSARMFEQNAFDGGGFATKQDYKGNLLALRYEMNALDLDRLLNLRIGATFNQEKMVYRSDDVMQSDDATEFEGFFAKAQSRAVENFNFEAGLRSDFNQMKNRTDTYQIGVTAYEDLKFEYSTGFKQPSLFQLFSAYGNTNLKPERSTSYSANVDHKFSDGFFVSYTYFVTRFENLIVIRGSPQIYENVDSSNTKGHELEFVVRDEPHGTTYTANIGYQEPYDTSQGTWLVRRPLRTVSVKVRQEFEKLGLGAELIHNGSRRDRTGATTYGTLASYTLLNLIADYQFNSKINFFARVQNVADHHYESSYGFYDEGLNAQAGVGVDF